MNFAWFTHLPIAGKIALIGAPVAGGFILLSNRSSKKTTGQPMVGAPGGTFNETSINKRNSKTIIYKFPRPVKRGHHKAPPPPPKHHHKQPRPSHQIHYRGRGLWAKWNFLRGIRQREETRIKTVKMRIGIAQHAHNYQRAHQLRRELKHQERGYKRINRQTHQAWLTASRHGQGRKHHQPHRGAHG